MSVEDRLCEHSERSLSVQFIHAKNGTQDKVCTGAKLRIAGALGPLPPSSHMGAPRPNEFFGFCGFRVAGRNIFSDRLHQRSWREGEGRHDKSHEKELRALEIPLGPKLIGGYATPLSLGPISAQSPFQSAVFATREQQTSPPLSMLFIKSQHSTNHQLLKK